MPRLTNESISQFAIRVAWETGHFWNPDDPNGHNIRQEDLKLLQPHDPVVVAAMISMSRMEAGRYTRHVLDQHGRLPHFDGEIGPAIVSMVLEHNGRCPIPDYVPPPGTSYVYADPDLQTVVERMQAREAMKAIGNGGNWPGCNNIGPFHCAAMRVNTAGINSRVAPLWKQVMLNVRQAYAGIGLLWKFIGMDNRDLLTGEEFNGRIQTEFSFVQKSDGWIGLAIVTTNESCESTIWLKLLATYLGGSSSAEILNQQTTLLAHEAGHNSGLGHSTGGVMNPSIVNGLPTGVWPENDPSTRKLKTLYGGVPVPIPGGGPAPNPDPPPGSTVERQIRQLQVDNAVQEASIQWSIKQIQQIKNKIGLILLAIIMCCSSASAQVVSSDGRSIVISGNGPVVTAPVLPPAESQKPDPLTTLLADEHPAVVAPVQKHRRAYLAMFTATYCRPCQRWKNAEKWKVEAAGYTVREFEMTNRANAIQYGPKMQGGYPAFAVIDWDTGEWISGPFHGYMDSGVAIGHLGSVNPSQTVVKPVIIAPAGKVSAPIRYVQWPGWGELIDLETYNRNCNCGMCKAIRQLQREYWAQKKAFEESQMLINTVTPDQEGTPHALVEAMLDSMDLRYSDVLADLGCGDARILIAAARRGIRGLGVELDPERAGVARRRVKEAGFSHLIHIETGDALEFDLSRATVATAYLYPPLLAKLSPKLKSLRVVGSPYHQVPGLPMTQVGDIWIYSNGG